MYQQHIHTPGIFLTPIIGQQSLSTNTSSMFLCVCVFASSSQKSRLFSLFTSTRFQYTTYQVLVYNSKSISLLMSITIMSYFDLTRNVMQTWQYYGLLCHYANNICLRSVYSCNISHQKLEQTTLDTSNFMIFGVFRSRSNLIFFY